MSSETRWETKMNETRDLAFDLIKQQKFAEALELLPSLIDSKPDNSNLHFLMGQCLRFTEKLPEAINCYIKAINISPNTPENFHALGIAYQLNENFEQAIDTLKKAIELDSNFFEAYNSIGLTYRIIGNFKEALHWYSLGKEIIHNEVIDRLLKEENPDPENQINDYGEKVINAHNVNLEKVHERIKSTPSYAIISNNIGVCLMEIGDKDAALELFKESIEFIPDGYNYPDPYEHLEYMRVEIAFLYVGVRNDEFGFYKEEWKGVKSIKNRDHGIYEGMIKNGLPSGQGTYTMPEMEKIVGEFKEGKPWNGTGYDKNGNITARFVNGETIEQ